MESASFARAWPWASRSWSTEPNASGRACRCHRGKRSPRSAIRGWSAARSAIPALAANSDQRDPLFRTMNFSTFFIRRPIFAGVLSIVIFLLGLLAMGRLPISEYPEVVPPTVVVRASYPGANPRTIAETVASPLEQAVNGVEESLYMFSQATSDGVLTLTVTFKLGTDIDKAQVQVQNRVSQALPKLPEEVRRLGVTTTKQSPDLTLVVHLF